MLLHGMPKNSVPSIRSRKLAILHWSPPSAGAAVLTEEELIGCRAAWSIRVRLSQRRDVRLSLSVRRSVEKVECYTSSTPIIVHHAPRSLALTLAGFPGSPDYFANDAPTGQWCEACVSAVAGLD